MNIARHPWPLAAALAVFPRFANAGDLIPLNRYTPTAAQVGVGVSFSGKHVTWTTFADDGVREVLIAPADDLTRARRLVAPGPEERPLHAVWAPNDHLLVSHQTKDRSWLDEVDIETGAAKFTLASGDHVALFDVSTERIGLGVYRDQGSTAPPPTELRPSENPSIAEEMIVYGAEKEPALDVRVVDLATGTSESVWSGPAFDRVLFDEHLHPRVGLAAYTWRYPFDGELTYHFSAFGMFRLEGEHRARRVRTVFRDPGPADVLWTTHDTVAFLEPTEGRSSVVFLDLETKREHVVLQSPGPDLTKVVLSHELGVFGVATYDERTRWWTSRRESEAELEHLARVAQADVLWSHRGDDDRRFAWLVGPTEPGGLWVQEVDGTAKRLLPSYGEWDQIAWRPMEPIKFAARDGLPLTAYVTRPDAAVAGPGPWPLVLYVHGGPWGTRDEFRWNPDHQRLADLGYAVMSINFRGSGGFGQEFREAANGQWGLAMQDDLLDGVAWAVEHGVADPARVAIDGFSYGGYATLQALVTAPGVFACGVAGGAPAVLYGPDRPGALEEDDPGKPTIGSRSVRVAASPLTHVAGLTAPLLVFHGEKDQQVPIRAVRGFVEAADAAGAPITFVVYPNGRHGFEETDAQAQEVVAARFLQQCLGGRAEGWDALPKQAALRVEVGADRLPGLVETLRGSG